MPIDMLRARLAPAVRERILAQVRAALRPRAELLEPSPLPASLRPRLAAAAQELVELRARIEALEDRQRQDGSGFHADMTIERVLRRHPGAARVLAGVHLPSCGGCSVRFDERLEEAAGAYGLDLEALLADLNALLTGPDDRVG